MKAARWDGTEWNRQGVEAVFAAEPHPRDPGGPIAQFEIEPVGVCRRSREGYVDERVRLHLRTPHGLYWSILRAGDWLVYKEGYGLLKMDDETFRGEVRSGGTGGRRMNPHPAVLHEPLAEQVHPDITTLLLAAGALSGEGDALLSSYRMQPNPFIRGQIFEAASATVTLASLGRVGIPIMDMAGLRWVH